MFVFKSGTALAVEQQKNLDLYKKGIALNEEDLTGLEKNLWVSLASVLAPNNLVLRQWCLIDLFRDRPTNKEKILKIIDVLSYGKNSGPDRIWGEGYSYFNYCLDTLNPWMEKFNGDATVKKISALIEAINRGFIATSYLRDGTWYPAPYGDLREEPLRPSLQIKHTERDTVISNITVKYGSANKIDYVIKARPLGLNTHITLYDSSIYVIDGVPNGFLFYQGYDKKYKNKFAELFDTLNIKRILSLF